MDSNRWTQIQSLFHEAADLPKDEQRSYLASACGTDDILMADVLALLEEDARSSSLLDSDVAHVAHQILNDNSPQPAAFQELGHYKIKHVLGEGGMGVVYLAEREDLGSLVAIKLLRDAWLSPARRERFAVEQRTLAQLNHPSIARLYDAGILADGTPWFVMEYVDGLPLTEYCRQRKCSIDQRLRLFHAVCEAVLYAHQNAVIHRDLKPSNILVKNDGSVRLLDFGIAKQIDGADAGADQTRTAMRMMTPAYASPEQIRGERVGIQTDVYSLGVILYELLAGVLPYDVSNRSSSEAENLITGTDPARPSTVVRRKIERQTSGINSPSTGNAAWSDLDVICLTAMHKDPQRRYRSVEALVRDLDKYSAGEPLDARPDTFRYRVGKFVGRNRRAVAAATAAFVIVIGLVIFFTVRLAIARNAALAETARTLRVQRFMTNLFEGGDKSAGPADSLRVVTLLDRGVQEAKSLDSDPEVQAEMYETLGGIYQKLGNFDQADSLLKSSLEKRKSIYGNDHLQVAESLVTLGILRDAQAKLEESEQLIRQGLEMTERHVPANHPAIARGMLALGKVLEDRGTYDKSIATLDRAVQLYSAPNSSPSDLADSLHELANAHYFAGHDDVADSLNRRVLEMYKQIYGDRHPRVADILINLGAIQYDRGNYKQAEQFDRQALAIVQAWYGNENPDTAIDMTILGRALIFQNRFDEGNAMLRQSLEIKERVFGEVHPSVASTLNDLGNAASTQNNYDAAEKYFQRMGDIYRQIYPDGHYLIGNVMSNLGSSYLGRKDWPRAESMFREAIRIYTDKLGPNHNSTAIARIKLGRALLRENHYAEAEVETRAGYDILVHGGMNLNVSWLKAARKDLIEDYTALNQTENVVKYKTEQAKLDSEATAKK